MDVIHGAGVAAVMWLLIGGRLEILGITPGNPIRRGLIVTCAVAYFVRTSVACHSFCRHREVRCLDAVAVATALASIHVVLAILGGGDTSHLSTLDVAGLEIYALGSYVSTRAARRRGNQLVGEIVLFSGYTLVTRQAIAFAIPVAILMLFALVNVSRLHRRRNQR